MCEDGGREAFAFHLLLVLRGMTGADGVAHQRNHCLPGALIQAHQGPTCRDVRRHKESEERTLSTLTFDCITASNIFICCKKSSISPFFFLARALSRAPRNLIDSILILNDKSCFRGI